MAAASTAPVTSLLVRGGILQNSAPYLQPALAVNAPPAMPRKTGPYRIVGATAEDYDLFALDFASRTLRRGDADARCRGHPTECLPNNPFLLYLTIPRINFQKR